ncbi:MAG: hypothetical protein WCE45_01660 [Sedimentisphaerales bacterium]
MATITFNCPNCRYLCAFKDIYTGRRARCLNCNQIFIIPTTENEKIHTIKPPKEEFDEPLPGFYEAVFKKSLPAIFNRQSLATLLFIFIVTTLKFFTAHLDYSFAVVGRGGPAFTVFLPIGSVIAALVWGGIFWCYAEIIYATAFDIESLPQIIFGGGAGYLFSVLQSLYSFFVALVVVLLPAIVAKIIFIETGIRSNWPVFPFVVLGMFLFPMAVLAVSICRGLTMLFRPDYFFVPIKKAFLHYLFVAGLFILVWQLQYVSLNYGNIAERSSLVILMNLLAVLAIQILAIFTMRATGLFYRHFACYFKW